MCTRARGVVVGVVIGMLLHLDETEEREEREENNYKRSRMRRNICSSTPSGRSQWWRPGQEVLPRRSSLMPEGRGCKDEEQQQRQEEKQVELEQEVEEGGGGAFPVTAILTQTV